MHSRSRTTTMKVLSFATDGARNSRTASVTFSVDPVKPTISSYTAVGVGVDSNVTVSFSEAMNRSAPGVSAKALDVLLSYEWPGNVRELENAVERAMVISREPEIQPSDFPFQLQRPALSGGRSLEDVERTHIERVLNETEWNLSRSARILEIDRTTLYNKLKRYGLK